MKNWDSLNIFWNALYCKYLKICTNSVGLPTGILLATKVLFQAIHPPHPRLKIIKQSWQIPRHACVCPWGQLPGWPLISALYLFMLPTLCISFSLEDKRKIVRIGDTSTKFHIIIWSFSSMQWKESKTKSIRKLSNFNFWWTKTLYHNNLNNNTQESCIESRLLGDKFYCQLVLLCCYAVMVESSKVLWLQQEKFFPPLMSPLYLGQRIVIIITA